ncbi:hypothetical protein [Streptomyces sp. NPDC046727]|uniref:hypothetical protein n=1 Tax=Streptomyces sp. NPDC046727 TaxID=3155373 RepID=UPI0033F772D9
MIAAGKDNYQQVSGILKAAKGEDIVDVCGGLAFSLALTRSGRLLVAGEDAKEFASLLKAADGRKITAVSARLAHALALTDTGELLAGGSNGEYECSEILDHARGKKIVSIAAGTDHSLALTDTGELLAGGSNGYGEVSGIRKAAHGKNISFIHAARSGSFAITSDGHLLYEGANHYRIGAFKQLDGSLVAIADSEIITLALTRDGTLHAAGAEGFTDAPAKLQAQLAGRRVAAITAGLLHVLAITEDHGLVGTGRDKESQVSGIISAASGKRITAAAGGRNHSLAVATPQPSQATGHTVQATFTRTQHPDHPLTLHLRRGTTTHATLTTGAAPTTFTAPAGEPIQVIVGGLPQPPAPGALYLTYDPATDTTTLNTGATQLPPPLTCTNPAPNHLTFTWNA